MRVRSGVQPLRKAEGTKVPSRTQNIDLAEHLCLEPAARSGLARRLGAGSMPRAEDRRERTGSRLERDLRAAYLAGGRRGSPRRRKLRCAGRSGQREHGPPDCDPFADHVPDIGGIEAGDLGRSAYPERVMRAAWLRKAHEGYGGAEAPLVGAVAVPSTRDALR